MTGRLRGQLVIMMEPTEEQERDDLATNSSPRIRSAPQSTLCLAMA